MRHHISYTLHSFSKRKWTGRLYTIHRLCLCLALIFILPLGGGESFSSYAQNNRLYTTQHGLRTSNINGLSLDSRGLLWIASKSSICYFDGTGFHYLPNLNPKTGQPYYASVNEIKEDKDDCYWVLTNFGLFYYDSRHLKYDRILCTKQENENYGYTLTQMLDIPGKKNLKLVVTSGYGLYYIDTEKRKINEVKSTQLNNQINANFVISACIDQNGKLWASTIDNELICYDLNSNKRVAINRSERADERIKKLYVNELLEVPNREAIYMTTDDGILKYDGRTKRIELLEQTTGRPYTTMLYSQSGELLVGTDSYGVMQLDAEDRMKSFELNHLVFDLSTGKVRDIVQDSEGNLIIALFQKGIFIVPRENEAFHYFAISPKGDGRNSSCITSIQMDSKGNYWIGTDGSGVFTTDGLRLNTAHTVNEGLNKLLIQSIAIDREDRVWVGSYGGGIQCCEPGSNRFVTPDWLSELQDSRISALSIDRTQGILYAGTSGLGVLAINLNTHSYTQVECIENQGVWNNAVYVDPDHTLWAAELANIGYFNPITGIRGILEGKFQLHDSQCITSMGKGNNKRILIGGEKGLTIYNPTNGTAELLLPKKPVYSICQTATTIWVASSEYIYAIEKNSHKITTYNSLSGHFIGEFHRNASLDNHDGNLLFGCDNGILYCTPSALRSDRRLHTDILFTYMRAGDEIINYSDSTDYMDVDLLKAERVNLRHNQNTFSLHFTVPYYGLNHQIHYEYKLQGYDKEWIPCTDAPTQRAIYSNLDPGTYTLHVRASLEGTPESTIEKTIEIHISAPWYDTTLAHIGYLLLLAIAGYVVYRHRQTRLRQKRALQSALQNEEIKEHKLQLFTSITHELRTPLTMILTPLKQLMGNTQDEQTHNNLNVMKHNCDRLLDIVKQITDIRKIDAGQFKLHFEEVDLCSYTQEVAQSFMGVASVKHINFSIENHESVIGAWIDPIHFEKVLVNILSNAFKFTPDNGSILIRNQRVGGEIELSIFNTGSHINEDDMQHIFERFYQSNEGQKHAGSGIGLNLAYELVQLHHAHIKAINVEPDGVEFKIRIPAGFVHLSAEELEPRHIEEEAATTQAEVEVATLKDAIETRVESIQTEASTNEGNTFEEKGHQLPNLLIVDDSKELCEYLHDQLSSEYNITLAFSGNSAWNIILKKRPDLIITDMKMPDGDGMELCRKVKSNPEIDHTPIIMLTGEGDEKHQLEALDMHVDHFMQKPFNVTLLQGVIKQILSTHENIKRHIQRRDISNDYESVEMVSGDDKLFERIKETVQKHLDNDTFSVQELATEVGISRVHLNRKMKEKYGMSPNIFIRTYRLKQAAYLLLHNNVNVSEVAYRVGFSTHSYFSSSFREFFGMTPKEFVAYYNDPERKEEAAEKLLDLRN